MLDPIDATMKKGAKEALKNADLPGPFYSLDDPLLTKFRST
jgi:hypothetical protein